MLRKVIQITAEDSPNVQYARMQIANGLEPDDTIVIPNVLTWSELQHRLKTWDENRITVGIHAKFDEGPQKMLFPKSWLDRANLMAQMLEERQAKRRAKAAGVDPAEGGDDTSTAVVDDLGLIDLLSVKTPDTAVVTTSTMDMIQEYGILPENVVFDRGGGGKQHADRLRRQGLPVRTVFFGSAPTIEPRRLPQGIGEKREILEERHAYLNLRAEMYWELRMLLDPEGDPYDVSDGTKQTFAINFDKYPALREQMAPIPLTRDQFDRLYILPKNQKSEGADGKTKTLVQIIGRSPDDLDALVLGVHGMLHKPKKATIKVM